MSLSLQKASLWKRISAYMFDAIISIILTIGIATVCSTLLGYDGYSARLETYSQQYAQEYGIELNITDEEYNALSEEEKALYEQAEEAFGKDENVIKTYTTIFYLTLTMLGISLLVTHLILYFAIPLFFHDGQTLGKKIFGIAVMRTNSVKVSNPVLFVRAILGQCVMETMVPVLIVTMIYFGVLGIVGTITLGLFFLLQLAVILMTKTRSPIHDLLSDTVVVDYATQMIFETEEELIKYKQEQHALEVAQSEKENY